MKSVEAFEVLFETELKLPLELLEKRRKSFLKKFFIGAVFMLTVVLLVVFVLEYANLFVGILLFAAGWIAFRKLFRNFRNDYAFQYKKEIISRMIPFIDDRLTYDPENGIAYESFRNSSLFPQTISKYSSEDYIHGTIGQTDIAFAEVHAQNASRDAEGYRSNHDLFRGLFLMADLNKHFTSRTIVVPDLFGDSLGGIGRFLQKEGVWGGSDPLIKLEDPEFENHFAVYGNDPAETRVLLSPALMKRILKFRKENGYPWLSFADGNLYLALPLRENLFEPRMFKSALDFKPLKKYFAYVILMVNIVEDFNLRSN